MPDGHWFVVMSLKHIKLKNHQSNYQSGKNSVQSEHLSIEEQLKILMWLNLIYEQAASVMINDSMIWVQIPVSPPFMS